tara:strand:+ start:1243 stop:1836 length:594 start_codon:yes stop_codon:yes gene_type:complete
MSKNRKKLLNENTIRRFMKLAEIDSLSETFISDHPGKFAINEQDEEPFEPAELGAEMEEEPELPPEPDEEPEGGAESDVVELTDAVETLMGVVSRMTGVDIDVGGEAEGEEDMPLDEPIDEFPEEGGEEEELPPGNEMYEDLEKEDIELQEDEDEKGSKDLEERLARRVAARLVKESRSDKMASRLAERIVRRLKNG